MEVAKCHRNLILRSVRRHSQPLGGQASDRSRTFSAARSIAVSSSPGQRPWVCRPRARAPFGRPWGRPQRQWLRPPPAREAGQAPYDDPQLAAECRRAERRPGGAARARGPHLFTVLFRRPHRLPTRHGRSCPLPCGVIRALGRRSPVPLHLETRHPVPQGLRGGAGERRQVLL